MHRTGARFEQIGQCGGDAEADKEFEQVVAEVFLRQGNHAQEFLGEKGRVGENQCQQQ